METGVRTQHREQSGAGSGVLFSQGVGEQAVTLEKQLNDWLEQNRQRVAQQKIQKNSALKAKEWCIIRVYFFLGLVAIGGVAWYMWPINSSNTDNFVRTAGVLLMLIVGIMTSHMTRLNARLQTDALAEVEDIRLHNAAQLASIQGNITVAVNQATKTFEVNLLERLEKQKANYVQNIEEFKDIVKTRSEGYEKIHNIVFSFYEAFKTMEKGVLNREKAQKLFEQMADFQRYVLIMPESYQRAWYLLMQHAKEMLAHVNIENSLKPEFIWRKLGPDFKDAFDQLIDEASKRSQIGG